jgi:hypothetical protein
MPMHHVLCMILGVYNTWLSISLCFFVDGGHLKIVYLHHDSCKKKTCEKLVSNILKQV